MTEQDKKTLINEMTEERKELLSEVSATQYWTTLVRKKAKEVIEHSKQYGQYSVKGQSLLHLTCFKSRENYRIISDSKALNYSEKDFKEMRDAISIIAKSGYDVQKNFPSEESEKDFIESYEIKM